MNPHFPPGPSGGLFGMSLLKRMREDLLGHCVELARAHGDCVHYKVAGAIHVFQFTHPDQAHEVLVGKNRAFQKPKRLKQVLGQWNGNGLVVNEGESWVRQRRLVQAAFKPQRLLAHIAAVTRHAERMVEGWRGKTELDVAAEFGRLTLGVVAEALFGADVESKTDEFIRAVAVLNEAALKEMVSPVVLPMWAPLPGKRRLRDAVERLDRTVRDVIAQRRRSGQDRGDLLSMLLLAVDEEGGGGSMTDEQARDESVNLMLGGNETTATALTWTAHLLAQHPEVQDQAHREIDEVLGSGAPTAETVPRLRALTMAFKEAMRLYPPAYMVPREAAEDVEIGGYVVPRGSTVHLVPYVTQRDARWFDKPDTFRPERFAAEDTIHRAAYFPFGLGPRACVGRALAMMEAPVALAVLLRHVRLRPAPGARPVEMEAQVSLHPKGGLRLAIEPR
jgi:cytochrome P450